MHKIPLVLAAHMSSKCITVLVKLIGAPLNFLVFGRLVVAGLFSSFYLVKNWRSDINLLPYLLRGALRYTSISCTYYGYRYLSLQTIAAISFTEPFFILILSSFFLSEVVTLHRLFWLACGYVGAYIATVGASTIDKNMLAVLAMFCANIISAVDMLCARKTVEKDGPGMSVALLSVVVGTIAILRLVTNGPHGICQLSPVLYAQILLVGIVGLIHTSLFHFAVSYVPPSFISTFQYTNIPFAMILDYFVFGISIDWNALLGSAIIILSAVNLSK